MNELDRPYDAEFQRPYGVSADYVSEDAPAVFDRMLRRYGYRALRQEIAQRITTPG